MPEEQESEELLSDTQDPMVEGTVEVPDGVINTPETMSKLDGKCFSHLNILAPTKVYYVTDQMEYLFSVYQVSILGRSILNICI